jgi:hypothetical protein
MANSMRTKFSIWTYDESGSKWNGICLECKGEKAKHTPQILKDLKIKPCSLCTNIEEYDRHVSHKEKINV